MAEMKIVTVPEATGVTYTIDDSVPDLYSEYHAAICTLREAKPEIDIDLVTRDVVERMVNELADDFVERLMQVGTANGMEDSVLQFVNEYLQDVDTDDSEMETSEVDDESETGAGEDNSVTPEEITEQEDAVDCPMEPARDAVDDLSIEGSKPQEVLHGESGIAGATDTNVPYIRWLDLPREAVKQGRTDLLQLCQETGIPLNTFRGPHGESLLHTAISTGSLEITALMLQYMDADIVCNNRTPLMNATKVQTESDQKIKLLKILIDAGASLGMVSHALETPLHTYVHFLSHAILNKDGCILNDENWKHIIDILSLDGSLIGNKDWAEKTALQWVCEQFPPLETYSKETESDLLEVINYLLGKSTDMSVTDKYGHSVVHSAVVTQNPDLVKYLVDHKCPVNLRSKLRLTPAYLLCSATEWCDSEDRRKIFIPIIKELLRAGCDLNIPSLNQTTPLHQSAAKCPREIVKFLIESGADVNRQDFLGRTPLHFTPGNKDTKVVEVLVQAGADVNAKNKYGYTALHYACMFGESMIVAALIRCGADPCATGDLMVQPLHLAAERGDEPIFNMLHQAGANINCLDAYGATPLHYAGFDGMPEQTQALILCGADAKIEDKLKQTPLSLALKMGLFKVAELLTDDHTKLKFGDLSSFPNRPAIPQEDLGSYIDNIVHQLAYIGTGERVARSILNNPGLGILDMSKNENVDVEEAIRCLIHDIVRRMGELDSRFEGEVIKAGSSYEGCKIGYPNEFDYVVRLKYFESLVAHVEPLKDHGFAKMILKEHGTKEVEKFVTDDRCLSSRAVYLRFKQLFIEAGYDVHPPSNGHIYCGTTMMHTLLTIFSNQTIRHRKLMASEVTWRGPQYKGMTISLDVNPVICVHMWPQDAITSTRLLANVCAAGVHLFPKEVPADVNTPYLPKSENTAFDDSVVWRFSFSQQEMQIFRTIPQVLRETYALVKAVRLDPMTPALIKTPAKISHHWDEMVDSGEVELPELNSDFGDDKENDVTGESSIPTYYLKQLFLHEIEALYDDVNQELDESKLPLDIVYRVYKALDISIETNRLKGFFVRNHNIYSPSDEPSARRDFCKSILRILTAAGFDKI